MVFRPESCFVNMPKLRARIFFLNVPYHFFLLGYRVPFLAPKWNIEVHVFQKYGLYKTISRIKSTFSMPQKQIKKSRTGIKIQTGVAVIPILTDWTCHCMEPKGLHPFALAKFTGSLLKSERLSQAQNPLGWFILRLSDEIGVRLSAQNCSQKESKITHLFYLSFFISFLIPSFYKFTDFFLLALNQSFRLPLR